MSQFEKEVKERIDAVSKNSSLRSTVSAFMQQSILSQYSYNWFWQGRPIIQYPQDMMAMQEIIWLVKPDLIIETGIAHGGSLIMNASYLAMLEYCEAVELEQPLDPRKPKRKVLGIDIDIRPHNRTAIEEHPMFGRIELFEGSSIAPNIIQKVYDYAKEFDCILVCLDSNHTHHHVFAELEAYAPLVSKGSYCIVFDTIIEDMPSNSFSDRPWDKGNNAKTAVWEYSRKHSEFKIDKEMESKLLITVAPDGFLRKIK